MSKPKDLRSGADAPVPTASPPPSESKPAAPEKPAPVEAVAAPSQSEQSPRRSSAPAREASVLSLEAFRFRFGPAFIAVLVILLLLPPGFPSVIVDTLSDFIPLPVHGSELPSTIAAHIVMLLMALGAIYLLKRRYPQIDFGLHLPTGRSYVPTAIILGLLAGGLMALIDHAPAIITHSVPRGYGSGYGVDMRGWLLYYGILVGPTEEIPFRSLVVAWLAMSMPGRVRFRGFEMNGAGVVVAAIFTIGFGVYALVSENILIALGQIIYVFVGSVALAYWFEKSRSILAPIIGHNVALVTWQAATFGLVLAYR